MIRLLLLPLTLSSCVTLGTERSHLISTETVDGGCTDTFTAAVENGSPAHLSVNDHQHCATVERQTWAVSNYSRMAPTPRLVTAIAGTVAMLGAYTGLLFATVPTHPCCSTNDRVNQESSGVIEGAGYIVLLGVGFGVWALLGVRAESAAPSETQDVELERRELVQPYAGPLTLPSGKTLQLTGRGADVDPSELDGGTLRAGQSVIEIEGPFRTDVRLLP